MKTSIEWQIYYEENACLLLEIPWHIGCEVTEEERKAITSSVQDFQAGESSEGRHLFQYAKTHVDKQAIMNISRRSVFLLQKNSATQETSPIFCKSIGFLL